jgi:hypothetical protein
MNRRIPNGTYGGVRGRGLAVPSYSILQIQGANASNRLILEKIIPVQLL